MFELFFRILWRIKFTHWRNHGQDKLRYHELLDTIHEGLENYLDEYMELTQEDRSSLEGFEIGDLTPVEIVRELRLLHEKSKEAKSSDILSDWQGRLTTDIFLWIFKLVDEPTTEVFSVSDDKDLMSKMKEVLPCTEDFIFAYNSYLEGRRISN